MKTLKFVDGDPKPKVAILIKESSFKESSLIKYYVDPMKNAAIPAEEIVAFSLEYTSAGKAPAFLIKDYINTWLQSFKDAGVQYLFCADSAYFKGLTKERKADPCLGYVLPCAIPGFEDMQVIYSLGYGALIHNPNQQEKIDLSIQALTTHYHGSYVEIGSDIIHEGRYPHAIEEIEAELNHLLQFKQLAVDIETFSLNLRDAGLGTIAFSESKHSGCAMFVEYQPIDPEGGYYGVRTQAPKTKKLLKEFFEAYQGKLITHNGTFDYKCLIHALWMEHPLDWKGMIKGLEVVTRLFDDTKIVAYLALNSTARVSYKLKDLAQQFAGNWAENEIKDITRIPPINLLRYNLVDVLSTFYVWETYYPIMVAEEQEELYHSMMLPSMKTIIQIECHGLPLIPERVQEVKKQLSDDIARMESLLSANAYVKEATNRIQLETMKVTNAKLKVKQHPREKFQDPINFSSTTQLGILLYDVMELPVLEWTATGERAAGGDVIKDLTNHTQDPEKLEVLKALAEYAKVNKVLTGFIPTFEDAWIKADGRGYLHGSFNIGGTKSGRLASNNPVI